jgi:hypothetical protein
MRLRASVGINVIEEVRFALDSPVEEAGFELPVPLPSRTCAEPYRPA